MLDKMTNRLDFLGNALVLRAERQRAIASNIANADTPGYVARDFSFGDAMREATGLGSGVTRLATGGSVGTTGNLGANGIVGGGLPLATGAALAIKQRKGTDVAVCFFGDGANNEGAFHESLNIAAVWKLPVV